MATQIEIVPVVAFHEGVAAGQKLGRQGLKRALNRMLALECLKHTLGAMSRTELRRYAMMRLHTEPDYARYPELEDLYPERLDFLRGLAEGAGCSLQQAVVYDYVSYRAEIDSWSLSVHDLENPGHIDRGHCSGVLLVGRDGVLGAHVGDSKPEQPKPKGYRFRPPPAHGKWMACKKSSPRKLVLRKPRTGYIESWGVANEKGVGCCGGTSCSTLLDEPIEDTWPIGSVPLLRFARDVEHLAELYRRYTLHNWGRASQVWADSRGNGMIVEKSFRRIGIRMLEGAALWCTEGYWHDPEMHAFQRARRLEYIRKAGKHLGAGDMQYATDCAVRFTRLAELCHEPLGHGYRHMNRIVTDHAPFPRAVCRHGGPDTAPYDETVTMGVGINDLTHNRALRRSWVPWKKFPCEVPWQVTQYPAPP